MQFLVVHYCQAFRFIQGWDDVGFHGSPQIPTPNIDALAKSGVILNSYYVAPSSYATKAEFMTGKYASKLGTLVDITFSNKRSVLCLFQVNILMRSFRL